MKGCALLLAAVIACGPPPRRDPGGGGDPGTGPDASQGTNGCADGTELVYVIDQFNQRISTFDPGSKTFTDLGSLSCGAMNGATPFSMSVDRQAVAWVLYTSGELFRVQLPTLQCMKTLWTSPNGMKVFGMGFATNTPGGAEETLYIGGGMSQLQSSYTLAKL